MHRRSYQRKTAAPEDNIPLRMKNISALFLFLILILFSPSVTEAGWLIYHKPEFRGKVIDAETKEPIEGAVVVVVYKKHSLISGPGGGYTSVINVKETLTNKKGEFYFPSYSTVIQPNSIEDTAEIIIYKPGHGSYPGLQTSPPNVVSPEKLFSKEFGIVETVQIEHKIIQFTLGMVELPKLKTWEERWKANIITVGGDVSKSEWPLLNELIKKEDEWLERHKGWRIESK